jgi:pilus assembly protein CpaB
MTRRRGPLLLVISLLLAGLAAWVANNWLSARSAPKPGPVQEQVVTAAIDIPLGTKIEQRHLAMIDMLPGKSPKGSFHKYTDVIGKVTSSGVITGEILLAGRLADAGEGSALASVVDKNMRAVTVRVDDVVGVAGFLLPGNRVDVIEAEKIGNTNQVRAQTILSNVKVLAVDQTAASDNNQPVIVRAVTLEVTPADAEILMKGKTAGSIQLALRNPLDNAVVPTRAAPAPVRVVARSKGAAPAPRAVPQITVIRGTNVHVAAAPGGAESDAANPN